MIRPAGRKFQTIRVRFQSVAWCALLLVAFHAGTASAQSMTARVSVLSLSPARVKVEGTRAQGTTAWSFRNIYASVIGLGERIENLRLKDQHGADVSVRKLAPGEYEAASAATAFSYEMRLEPPQPATDAAYVSWLTNERGFLMLGDLLPLRANAKESGASATVRFTLPSGWNVASNEKRSADGQFETADAEQSVFFAGQDLRQRRERIGSMDFTLIASGEWAFTDEDAAKMAASILKDYAEAVGTTARSTAVLMLSPYPQPMSAERWSAETRGGAVMLLSGRSPSKTAGLAQLSVPLSHELFHLWVPNGLPALGGNYDWFYEGFTMYQAMRASVRLRQLTFQDYLNAVGRAYDIYRFAKESDKLSLLEASQQRWAGATMLVYSKGMLTAFLYDLTLRQRSNGKRALDDVYRELFRRYTAAETGKDGNAAVIAVLNSQGEMQDFTRRYVESAGLIDLEAAIAPFGLRVERGGARTHVTVSDSLTRSQRDLLRKFGYNSEERVMSKRERDEAKKRRAISPR
jgi:predicted metalloprotease with PDZ domain